WWPPKFPVNGHSILSNWRLSIAGKGPILGQIIDLLRLEWRDSRYTADEATLLREEVRVRVLTQLGQSTVKRSNDSFRRRYLKAPINQQLLSKSMSYYFVIVNPKDEAIYELEHSASRTEEMTTDTSISWLQLRLGHCRRIAAWSSSSMYLKTVDKFNDLFVSAFCHAEP
uniref:BEACH-type PH domain-containing protein n=1 Tax=Macrostomum lignano TaxID=282301 RepID=A0A1I8FHV2_9PLAT